MRTHLVIISLIVGLFLVLIVPSQVHAATLGGSPICHSGYHACVKPCKPHHRPVHLPPVHHKPPTKKPPVTPCNCASTVVLTVEKVLCNGAKVKVKLVI